MSINGVVMEFGKYDSHGDESFPSELHILYTWTSLMGTAQTREKLDLTLLGLTIFGTQGPCCSSSIPTNS